MTESPTLRERRNLWRSHVAERDLDGRPVLNVGVTASFTAEPLAPYLGTALLDGGIEAEIEFADFNQIPQVCLDPEAHLPGADVIVVLWRIEDIMANLLDSALATRGGDALVSMVNEAEMIGAMVAQLTQTHDGPVLVSTPSQPVGFGIDPSDDVEARALRTWRQGIETAFIDAATSGVKLPIVVDLAAAQQSVGIVPSFDERKWQMYRQPFAEELWAELAGRIAAANERLHTPPPKVLALDCDNTLWGGIVGEDGLGGIELGQAFPGSAFRDFQIAAKRLREQGILLAIVSKNELADVEEVFESHDDMVLKPDDIAAWRVNWEPKPDNLASIADELNLGIDSFVFVDDSDHEIASVRSRLPMVTALQVPEEPAELPSLLARSGLFRSRSVSAEDRQRTEMMLAERARTSERSEMSQEEFLASLGLWVEVFDVGTEQLGRTAQLINKTNQFNLTTRRRTESEVAMLLDSDDHRVVAMRVGDRFGDYGITGVAVVERGEDTSSIDTFLMSCRVLGRGVETAFLHKLVDGERDQGAALVTGQYLATQKNAQVADFYERNGFSPTAEAGEFEVSATEGPTPPPHLELR